MNTISRIISGLLIVVLGFSFIFKSDSDIFAIIFGFFLLGLGVFLFFNKKEDQIEEIKKTK